MKLDKIKVYHYFWMIAIAILIIGLSRQSEMKYVNFGDTYISISNLHAGILFSICYVLLGLGYWFILGWLKKPMIKWMTILHTGILMLSFIIYWMVVFYTSLKTDNAIASLQHYGLINTTLILELLLILFIAQPLYMVNFLVSVFRKRKLSV